MITLFDYHLQLQSWCYLTIFVNCFNVAIYLLHRCAVSKSGHDSARKSTKHNCTKQQNTIAHVVHARVASRQKNWNMQEFTCWQAVYCTTLFIEWSQFCSNWHSSKLGPTNLIGRGRINRVELPTNLIINNRNILINPSIFLVFVISFLFHFSKDLWKLFF